MERKTGARNKMITDPIELQLNQLMSIAFS
jgi:hypothetical protein